MLPIAFFPTDPRCHGNEIWDKISYNSASVRDFCDIFAPIGGFSGMGHRMLPILHFFPIDPSCHGNEIWDKIGYNGLRMRFLRQYGGFRGWAIECCQSHFS